MGLAPLSFCGWVFDPVFGWVWAPGFGGFRGGFVPWRPVTGIWVRSKPGLLGIVPVHPLDVQGKTPINISRGIFPVSGGAVRQTIPVDAGERWKPIRTVPKDVLISTVAPSAPPAHVPRTIMTATNPGLRSGTPSTDRGSSIVYDAGERRFVNREPVNQHVARPVQPGAAPAANGPVVVNSAPGNVRVSPQPTPSAPTRPVVVYAPRATTPPPAPRTAEGAPAHPGSPGGGSGTRYEPHAAPASSGARSAGPTSPAGASAPHSSAPAAAPHAAPSGRPH